MSGETEDAAARGPRTAGDSPEARRIDALEQEAMLLIGQLETQAAAVQAAHREAEDARRALAAQSELTAHLTGRLASGESRIAELSVLLEQERAAGATARAAGDAAEERITGLEVDIASCSRDASAATNVMCRRFIG